MPFVKGQSGNPGGKRKLSKAQRLAQRMRRDLQPAVIEALKKEMLEAAESKDRIAASKALLIDLPTEVNANVTANPLSGTSSAVILGALKEAE